MRGFSLLLLLMIALTAGGARAQAPLDVGSPEAAFGGGPIRLSKPAAARLRAHFQGDNVPLIPRPLRARLDAALAARDWPKVEAAKRELLAARGIAAVLQWEQTRFIATGGIGIAELHSRDIAESGSTGVSETAAMLWLYAVAVTLTDGRKCADTAAAEAHLEQLRGPAFDKPAQIVGAMAEDRLTAMRDLAIQLESVLSADRTDDSVCRVGLEVPAIRPDAAWRAQRVAARATLPAKLTALYAAMRPKPIPNTSARPLAAKRETASPGMAARQ